ncbi:hypothetical protein OVS_00910 [Mycoplasma ovis str. Michigan]|uniref:Uncharacterized protein n=1 Tax=Mycoplasma ovis str. Michigan TaxID=1415773 RepID=A0ABM5P121_9MOLU|nr:hypothetical protein OVS_00910 [Mycoplasma ovis str. Michigan]
MVKGQNQMVPFLLFYYLLELEEPEKQGIIEANGI